MFRLRQELRGPQQHDAAPPVTLGRKTVRLSRVSEGIHQEAPPENPHQLSHRPQTVHLPARQLRPNLHPVEQHADTREKVPV